MQNVVLVGHFTVEGRETGGGSPERYEIARVVKVGDDRWRFDVHMVYGSVDATLPVVVPIVWAGDTPMVSITDFTIPTLGTFTARVFFYDDRLWRLLATRPVWRADVRPDRADGRELIAANRLPGLDGRSRLRSKGPRKNKYPFSAVVRVPRSAIARREEGAYRRYSTPVRHGPAPTFAGWIGGRKWVVVLALALRTPA